MKNSKITRIAIIAVAVIAVLGLSFFLVTANNNGNTGNEVTETNSILPTEPIMKYGLPIEDFIVTYDTLQRGETLAEVLYGFGFTAKQVFELTQCPDSIFDARRLRPGQACILLSDKDSSAHYFIYEESPKAYITFDLKENYRAAKELKPVRGF